MNIQSNNFKMIAGRMGGPFFSIRNYIYNNKWQNKLKIYEIKIYSHRMNSEGVREKNIYMTMTTGEHFRTDYQWFAFYINWFFFFVCWDSMKKEEPDMEKLEKKNCLFQNVGLKFRGCSLEKNKFEARETLLMSQWITNLSLLCTF